MLARLSGLFLFTFLITAAILLGSAPITAFIDVPSAMIVFGITFSLLLCSGNLPNTLKAIAVFLSQADISESEQKSYLNSLEATFFLTCFSGFLGTLIGFIQMFQDLVDPSSLGQGIAVSSLTLFYGIIFPLFPIIPAQLYIRNKNIVIEEKEKTKSFSRSLLAIKILSYGFIAFVFICLSLVLFMMQDAQPYQENHSSQRIETSVSGTKGDIKLEIDIVLISPEGEMAFNKEGSEKENIRVFPRRTFELNTASRSKVIEIISEFSLEQLDSSEGKTELKKRLLVEIQKLYSNQINPPEEIYFSHYLLISNNHPSQDITY